MNEPDWDRISYCGGYLAIYHPTHHRAWSTGYVHLHILAAEYSLGRKLFSNEIVHHRDHDKLFNHPDNLQVVESHREHKLLHNKPQTILSLTCAECGIIFPRRLGQDPSKKGYLKSFCSRRCNGRHSRKIQLGSVA